MSTTVAEIWKMDLVDGLRYTYLSAALAVLVVFFIPPLRQRFLAYGARASTPPASGKEEKDRKKKAAAAPKQNTSILDQIADYTVPHDWFFTFYFVSTSLSAFWPGEILYLKGPLYHAVAGRVDPTRPSMNFEQLKIAWLMLLFQGGRRLYECLTLTQTDEFADETKPSSQMWVGHWVMGVLFYIATSIAIWIEGMPLKAHTLSYLDLIFATPTFRTIFAVLIFILATGFQHDCHTYLAYLKNNKSDPSSNNEKETSYKIPTHPAFQPLLAPHYTAECLIYFSLALVAAPQGAWMNWTLTSALVFVVVNLGVTANGTREWYIERFGAESVKGKWRMVPPVY